MAELRYVDWDGLVYYDGKIKEYIRDRSEELIKMGGIVPFDKLPDPSWQNLNYIYKITDKFTSNDRFEKPGYIYEPGTWVQVVDFNETYLYIIFNEESIGGTADIDLSDYYTKREVDKQIKDAVDSIDIPDVDLSNYYTKEEVDALVPDDFATQTDIAVLDEAVAGVQVAIEDLELALGHKANKSDLTGLATEEFVIKKIAEAELADQDVDLSAYYTKSETEAKIKEAIDTVEIPDVSNFATKDELEEAINSIEHPTVDLTGYATEEWVKVVTNTNKYEVLPLEGMFVQYNDNEVRINTEHVDMSTVPPQNAGDGSSDSLYYVTFRAYAPEGATSVIEGSSDKMDTKHSILATDKYGRKYTTIWSAIASKSGNTWSKFGDKSTVDKYLGFYYNFWWYNEDKLISKEKVRVILTNDTCHNDLVPDAVARRIDDKINSVNTVINNINENINNIEQNYVTNETLESANYVTEEYVQNQNFVTNQYIENNYTTTEQLEANYVTNTTLETTVETKVTEVIQEKVDSGEIEVKVDSISYDTW